MPDADNLDEVAVVAAAKVIASAEPGCDLFPECVTLPTVCACRNDARAAITAYLESTGLARSYEMMLETHSHCESLRADRDGLAQGADRLRRIERVVGGDDEDALRHLYDTDPLVHAIITIGRLGMPALTPSVEGGERGPAQNLGATLTTEHDRERDTVTVRFAHGDQAQDA